MVKRFLALVLVLAASPGLAQFDKETQCAQSAEIVREAIVARSEGRSLNHTRRMLQNRLDRTAGEELARWIYALPAAQLDPAVAELWKTQCLEAL